VQRKACGAILGLAIALVAGAANADRAPARRAVDFAPIAIGSLPRDLGRFRETTCSMARDGFSDCGAVDRQGRRYTFFDGALSRVDVSRETAVGVALPLGLAFGMDIDEAAKTFARTTGVRFDRGVNHEHRIVHSSDFVVPSSEGTMTSVELIADPDGQLAGIVQRTDF
jgi:hypothetical protein